MLETVSNYSTQLLYLYIKHNFYYKNSFLFVVVNHMFISPDLDYLFQAKNLA